jgi:quinol monooxygenase YgiN
MSITRINQFRAHAGGGDALRDGLRAFVPTIQASAGCLSCRVLQSRKDPAHVIVIEEWESVEAHQASLHRIPPDAFGETMKLVVAPPTGEYYD